MLTNLFLLISLAATGLCASTPPAGSITVGPGGQYSTLSAALQDTSSNTYFIYGTSIKERVVITRSNIKIYGQTSNALGYADNQVTITNNIPASSAGSNEASATVSVKGTDVSLYNINIANTYGKGSQAIALSIGATRFGGYGIQLTGFQDTLLANEGLDFISKSYISGAVDFIFGQRASLWITGSTIETVGDGWVTASGRSTEDDNYYVIDKTSISGTGIQCLGRPWRNYARVIFQNSDLGNNIQTVGWTGWNSSTPLTEHILFGEHNNTGRGAWNAERVPFATLLSSEVFLDTAFGGSTSWIDPAYL
ncbi:carbohydrate esterase family 8 protein [Botryobasidium botryosum FD-172 SS1]|uniref:Pectinesterase n=1 Tax=Botryobasidium botryosum (strain FD-172 SS1) TaxID=930990 RepID=A0A067MGM4_BOTB1|nr:carbohydrate esterase family 8 protein [Botryobasidium botryosum FD-172 SS1]